MKKVFAVIAIAAMFAACNNESKTTTTTEDSIRQADSLHKVWVEDSINQANKMMQDTMNKMAPDTSKMDKK
jgi:hypothetical protein